MALGTQTTSPAVLIIGQLAPVIQLTSNTVADGTFATILPAGATQTIKGYIATVGTVNGFYPQSGQAVPRGATLGTSTAVLTAGGLTLSLVTNVIGSIPTQECPPGVTVPIDVPFEPNYTIEYDGGRFDRVILDPINAGTLEGNQTITGDLIVQGNVSLGNANTDTLGFYGVTPVARPTAFTQTYATASKTVADLTSATLTDSTTGTANTTVQDVTGAFSQTILNNNFADLVAQINALRADLVATKNNLNSALDDLQALGLFR